MRKSSISVFRLSPRIRNPDSFNEEIEVNSLSGFNYSEINKNLSLNELISSPQDDIHITVAPTDPVRRYNNDEEAYMRITKTNINSAWRNNSYLSEGYAPEVPSKLNYWLFGNFKIHKNI